MGQFTKMTMREVDYCLKKIQIRNHNAFAMRASLHGYKIKPIHTAMARQELATPEKNEKALKAMEKSISKRNLNGKK